MARGGSRDSRETFLLDSLRLRVKPSVPKAPQENSVEFYHRDGAFYWLDSEGVEHSFVTTTVLSGSGFETQENNSVIVASTAILNFAPGFIVTNPAANKATISLDSEVTQDLVAAMIQDSADLDFTYNDGAGTISGVLTATGVTAGTYGSGTTIPVLTIDAKGRVTAASSSAITRNVLTSGGLTGGGSLSSDLNLSLDTTANVTFNKLRLGPAGATNANVNFDKTRITTTNNTVTTAVTFPTTTNTAYVLKWWVIGARSDVRGKANAYERTARFKNIAGVITTSALSSDYTSQDTGGVTLSVGTAGTDVLLRIQGPNAQTWQWNSSIQWTEVT